MSVCAVDEGEAEAVDRAVWESFEGDEVHETKLADRSSALHSRM